MSKKVLSLVLGFLVVNLLCAVPAAGKTAADEKAAQAAKVKAGIARLGTGPQARVEVKLRDGTRLKGYVSELGDDHFVLMDSKTGTPVAVVYAQVKQTKGNNLSTGVKIAIVVGIAFVALIILKRIFYPPA